MVLIIKPVQPKPKPGRKRKLPAWIENARKLPEKVDYGRRRKPKDPPKNGREAHFDAIVARLGFEPWWMPYARAVPPTVDWRWYLSRKQPWRKTSA